MPVNVQVCCICMEKCIYFQKIADPLYGSITYMDKLEVIVPNKQWHKDLIICSECTDKLDVAYLFVQLCIKSEIHRKEQLEIILKKEAALIEFTCHDCGKSFKSKLSLKRHLTQIHTRPKKSLKNKVIRTKSTLNKINDIKTEDTITNEEVKLENKDDEITKEEKDSIENLDNQENKEDNSDICSQNLNVDITNDIDNNSRSKRSLKLHLKQIHAKRKNTRNSNVDKKENVLSPIKQEAENDVKVEELGKEGTQINSLDVLKEEGKENSLKCFESLVDHENKDDIDIEDHDFDGVADDTSNYSTDEDVPVRKKREYKRVKKGPREKGPKRCEECDIIFDRVDKYDRHMRKTHTFEKPYKCDECDAEYYNSYNLTTHKRKHRNFKPFVCSICGKCFVGSNDLWQHNKTHNMVRQYHCDLCERSFKTHSNLRTHKLQMHQDPKTWKFVCTVCGKKFPLNNNLNKHMKRHEGIKDFVCQLCDKAFVEKIDLQMHSLTHSNKRNFKCKLCEKAYKKKETLRRHLKVEHDLGNYKVYKPEKKFACTLCPRVFPFNNKLQRHMITHTGEKPFKCDYCERKFRDKYDKNLHLRKDHNIEYKDEYSCTFVN